MNQLHLLGSGYDIPAKRVSNDDLSTVMDTSHEWIASRTGIHARHIAQETTTQLAANAAQKAIDHANIDANDIDLVIVATMTPDYYTPSTASLVQATLGLNDNKVTAFDLNAACSGYMYAMQVASSLLTSGQHQCALVIGAEIMSKLLNWDDRGTSILFGDGAGAMILSTKPTPTSIAIKRHVHYTDSKGDTELVLACPALAPRTIFTPHQTLPGYLTMNGSEVFRFAVDVMNRSINEVLHRANVDIESIDLIVPHQANQRIIQSVIKKYGFDPERIFMNLQEYGNTSAASIAIAFAQLQENKNIHPDMNIILVGFGGGFTWGAIYLEL